jgi:hypothetical protein
LQDFLDRISHFLTFSLCAGSAIAGLTGPRQRQYARQNVADGHTGTAFPPGGMGRRRPLPRKRGEGEEGPLTATPPGVR